MPLGDGGDASAKGRGILMTTTNLRDDLPTKIEALKLTSVRR
jgi:hypothetical protein